MMTSKVVDAGLVLCVRTIQAVLMAKVQKKNTSMDTKLFTSNDTAWVLFFLPNEEREVNTNFLR